MPTDYPVTVEWRNKPTDRFILKWIKLNLSARITPGLAHIEWLRPWMITLCSTLLGILAGTVFALGFGFWGGLIAALSQVLDGVDGQLARYTGKQSPAGAFLDSVLDRYSDGAVVIGLIIYSVPLVSLWVLLPVGFFALIGSSQVSYSSARAEALGLVQGAPTLASKGTRTTVSALSGLLSPLWHPFPLVGLCYLAVHANLVVLHRIWLAYRSGAAQ